MRTIYTAGRVLTGVPGEEIRDAAVTVVDGAIDSVGARGGTPDDADRVVDFGADATIMPGLIDTHVHLAFDGGPAPVARLAAAGPAERLGIMLRSARELLSAGVTTARDLGAPDLLDIQVKQLIASGLARGPRLQTVTAPLTVTGGHCWFLGGECDGVDGVRTQVRKARRDGADAVKIMATGGNMTPGTLPSEAQFTQEELNAIVAEAHKYKMRVTAHGHGAEGIRRAIEAGVDSIEHFSFTRADGSFVEEEQVVASAIAHGTYVCKTICACVTDSLRGMFPPDMMRSLADRGARIVAGTDGGIDRTPHLEYVFGLEGMAAFGLTNDEVLAAATVTAAASLGLDDVTGSLQPGKSADLIAVHGNPRDDLGALRRLELVVARGEEYRPEFVSSMAWNDSTATPQYRPA